MRASWVFLLLALGGLGVGCDGTSGGTTDARRDGSIDGMGLPVGDLPPAGDGGDGAAPGDRPGPYDAGPPPACSLAAFTRHVLEASPGVDTLELSEIVPLSAGYLLVARQSASRLFPPDGAAPRRDTVDMALVSPLGVLRAGWATLYDSTSSQSDLSVPTVSRAGDGALVLFRESRGLQGEAEFVTRLRGVALGPDGARRGMEVLLPDRGDAFAAPLPDGTVLALSSRVVEAPDGGVPTVTPNAVRIRPDGTVVSARGVDLTNVIPITAESVLMRQAPGGVRAIFRVLVDVHVVRFDAAGIVDTRVPITRGLDAVRLDDAAVLEAAVVLGWDEARDDQHAIQAAVLDPEGRVLYHGVLERFTSQSLPSVAVTAVHGGAAVTWIRGTGEAAVLRGAVLQPDGVVRMAPRDLLPVVNADGRLVATGEGRMLVFAARDRAGSARGVTVGGLCLPE